MYLIGTITKKVILPLRTASNAGKLFYSRNLKQKNFKVELGVFNSYWNKSIECEISSSVSFNMWCIGYYLLLLFGVVCLKSLIRVFKTSIYLARQ